MYCVNKRQSEKVNKFICMRISPSRCHAVHACISTWSILSIGDYVLCFMIGGLMIGWVLVVFFCFSARSMHVCRCMYVGA